MDYGAQYTTSYGANGGADGGGFVGGEPNSSQAGANKGYGKDTVRPVTIKQLLEAQQAHPDAEFKIDGDAITQVTFVGQVRSISKQTTNVTYKLDDGTGIIEVKVWSDSDAPEDPMDTDSKSKVAEDVYCRVWGRIKAFNNKRHVGAHVIRPITDYNEINYHLLEATAIHLHFTQGPPAGQTGGAKAVNGAGAQQGYDGGASNGLPSMSSYARKVFQALKSTDSNEGLHVQMLSQSTGMPPNDVYKGAEELLGTGIIFTTVDDNTWALLDG